MIRLWRGATWIAVGAITMFLSVSVITEAANTPCSGRKGGIAGCQGETFLCNDGSVSASKKSCFASIGGASGLLGSTEQEKAPMADGECSCRSAAYCTGPRGGRYCISNNGQKSYLKSGVVARATERQPANGL